MKQFRYGFDPLCIASIVCYAANRWLLPASLKGVFLRGYFSDLLFIPAALPLVLWLQRRLGMRVHDRYPTSKEVLFHLSIWSVAAEVVAPILFHGATGDMWDVGAYAAGAIVALCVWR